jgi:hypothetical protein
MKKLLIATAMCACASLGISTNGWAEWKYVGGTEDFDAYIDLATIRKQEGTVEMWVLREYATVHRVGERMFLSIEVREEYDCHEGQSRALFMVWYSGRTGSGEVLATYGEPTRWRPIGATTMSETLWKTACKQ